MKSKFLVVALLAFVFAFNVYAVNTKAQGQGQNQEQQQVQTANQGEENQLQVQTQEQTQEQTEEECEGCQAGGQQLQSQNQEQEKSQQGQVNAQEHRSVVAEFVHSLLDVADRQGGIGQQVRLIAQQQNQSATNSIEAMEQVQTRSKIRTFFFGTDYKNLGNLRSEMVETRNRLEQLNRLMENVENEGDKTELQSQIQELEQEQTKIENFIKAEEGRFSLLGWFVKLFNR